MEGPGEAPSEGFKPAPSRVLSDLVGLRVVAHPLRRRIVDCLIQAERAVKEIGRLLGIDSNTLYYHVGELERIGLIQRTRTVAKAGVRRTYYRATARYYQLAPGLLYPDGHTGRRDAGADFVAGAVEDGARNLREAFVAGAVDRQADVVLVGRRTARVSPKRAVLFRERLGELVREFVGADEGEGEERMELVYAFFPRVAASPAADDGGQPPGLWGDARVQ